MEDILRKSLLTGIGLLSISKDRCEEWAQSLKEKGQVSEKEGKELAQAWLDQAESCKGEVSEMIDKMVGENLKKFKVVPKSEFDELKEELNKTNAVRETERDALTAEVEKLKEELSSLKGSKES